MSRTLSAVGFLGPGMDRMYHALTGPCNPYLPDGRLTARAARPGQPNQRRRSSAMKSKFVMMIALAAVLAMASSIAIGKEKTMVISPDQLTWKDMGIPGVKSAVVTGDMTKGPS